MYSKVTFNIIKLMFKAKQCTMLHMHYIRPNSCNVQNKKFNVYLQLAVNDQSGTITVRFREEMTQSSSHKLKVEFISDAKFNMLTDFTAVAILGLV